MATYAENAHRREIATRRRVQDARDAAQHRAFDLQAQDRTPKSDRPHFAVVGEGSRASQEAFRRGYDAIVWRSRSRGAVALPGLPAIAFPRAVTASLARPSALLLPGPGVVTA